MRMKEICERTGLTDRAVRLYIENGLVFPERTASYSGRESIRFSEEDAAVLSRIATLRKAAFSIADIRTMTETPEEIPQIVARRRESLADEIGKNERILAMLSDMDPSDMVSVSAVCAHMQTAAQEKTVPKEDSAMTKTDIHRYVQKRLPMLFAALCLVYSMLYLTPKWINAMFAQPKLKAEGGYEMSYTFSLENFCEHWLIGVLGVSIAAALVFAVLWLVRDPAKHWTLYAVCIAIGVFLVSICCLNETMDQKLRLYEFFAYRYSIMHSVFMMVKTEHIEALCRLWTIIPPTLALVLTIVTMIRARAEE